MFVLVKDHSKHGCICFKCPNEDLVSSLPRFLDDVLDWKRLEVVVLNAPEVYGEYAPYEFIDDLGDFIKRALSM